MVGYTTQNISVIPRWLQRAHKTFLLIQVGYKELNISAASNTHAEQKLLLFQLGYTEKKIRAISNKLYRAV